MADTFPPARQRAVLLELAAALYSRDAALRRDECGDWRINGRRGHIYAIPGGSFEMPDPVRPACQIFVLGWTALGWTNAKKAFSFARLLNDGGEEGSFVLDRFPAGNEAAVIRHYVGVTKKREVSPDLVLRVQRNPPQEGRESAWDGRLASG